MIDIHSIIVYWSTLLMSLLLCEFAQHVRIEKSKIWWTIIISLPFCLIAANRFGVGTDYFPYLDSIHTIRNLPFYKCFQSIRFEPLYTLTVKVVTLLGGSDIWVFGAIELLALAPVVYVLLDFKDRLNIAFSFFLYYIMYFHFSLNGMRQAIALAFVVLACSKLIKDEWIQSAVWIVIASLFHTTAVVAVFFVVVYFFLKKKHEVEIFESVGRYLSVRRFIYYAAVILSPFVAVYIIKFLVQFPLLHKYANYIEKTNHIGISVGGIIRILIIFVPMFFIFGDIIGSDKRLRNLAMISLAYIPFMAIGQLGTWMGRILSYAQILLILLIPMASHSIQKISIKKIFLASYYISYFSLIYIQDILIQNYHQTFPYVSIFH